MELVARFRAELEFCDPANFKVGEMADVRDMMFISLQGSPTFCWTEMTTTTCCDDISHPGTPQRINSIQPNGMSPPSTIQAQLRQRFTAKMVQGGNKCSAGEGCTLEKRRKRHVYGQTTSYDPCGVLRGHYIARVHLGIQAIQRITFTLNTEKRQTRGSNATAPLSSLAGTILSPARRSMSLFSFIFCISSR